jgi:hypothetical protein
MILFVAKGDIVAHVIIEFISQFIEAYVIVVFWALYVHLLGGKELALQVEWFVLNQNAESRTAGMFACFIFQST